MPKDPKTFTITDPREYDGDPYEVASRAATQCEALLDHLIEATDDAATMARNAEMERNCIDGGDPSAPGWLEGAQGRRWTAALGTLRGLKLTLKGLRIAASYNPKKPPKG